MKTAIILYKPEQLASLDALVAQWSNAGETPTIVSLDAEIDYALEKRGIPFISGKTLQNRMTPAALMRSEEITRDICENEMLSFLWYKNISLLEPLRFSISLYLLFLLYYIEVIARFVDAKKDIERLVVPAPATSVSATSGILAEYEIFTVVEAARRVAESRNLAFKTVQGASVPFRIHNKLQGYLFTFKRMLFGVGLAILNAIMSLRRRSTIRILASDYWHNISPIFRELPEAELVLLDRTEALKAGFSNIWRYKMRLVHIEHFLSHRARREALACAGDCLKKWQAVRAHAWKSADLTFCGVSLVPVSENIMTRLVERALPRVMCDIEGTYAMYGRFAPETVLLRASASGQTHFAILALVAKQKGIPALEVQHGLQYLGPGSGTLYRPAQFVATYGTLVCDELADLGYSHDRTFPVGSPRFDAHVLDTTRKSTGEYSGVTFLSIAPPVSMGEGYQTYSTDEYFSVVGKAMRGVPQARLIISSRSNVRKALSEEAEKRGLTGVLHENLTGTPLVRLFAGADVVFCNYSTAIYEAMLYHKPVVLVALTPVERIMADFHFSQFAQQGAIAIAHSPEELLAIVVSLARDAKARGRMSAAAQKFLKEHFSFDGNASKRIAEQIRIWARDAHHHATY